MPPRHARLPLVAAFAVAALAAGCSDSTGPKAPAVARLVVAPPPDVVLLDDTVRLHARALDRGGNEIPQAAVRWSLSPRPAIHPLVALVDSTTGLLTAVSPGVVVVVATSGAARDSVAVTIGDAPSAVHVVATETVLRSGATLPYGAVVLGRHGDTLRTAPVSWSTTDEGVVGTTDDGVVTATAKGSTWVVAASGTARDSVQVMVDYTRISGPQPFVSVSMFQQAFNDGGCALTAAGAAYCWGGNGSGELGNGGANPGGLTTMVAVSGGLTFREVHGGYKAACGLTADEGALYCWGANVNAQFGTGSRIPSSSSVPLLGPPSLRFSSFSLSPDGAACGISSADAVLYCWGYDAYWTTGKDTSVEIGTDSVVAPVAGNLTATQVDVADQGGCAIGTDHATWCWGRAGPSLGMPASSRVPVQVAPPGTLVSVAVAEESACGLTAAGQALCWGDGPVASGTGSGLVTTPTPAAGALRFKKLSGSFWDFVCGLTLEGDVYCWGRNNYGVQGALGRSGGDAPASAPVQVLRGRKFVDVDDWCAVDAAGDVYCWGGS